MIYSMKVNRLCKAALAIFCISAPLIAQDGPPTRLMNAINWMDFERWVPSAIDTVLLPVGTLEAHGVANNGADNTVPEAIARDLAPRVNALVAPTIDYGVTTSLSAFPGTFRIDPEVFRAYVREVMLGLARTGFKKLIVVNGHGPNFPILEEVCAEVAEKKGVYTLVFNWWTRTAHITREIYDMEGGHAGVNENAAVLATNPEYVHQDYYRPELAAARQPGATLYPFPHSIILYKAGEGYPDFDPGKAERFYQRVLEELEDLVGRTLEGWQHLER